MSVGPLGYVIENDTGFYAESDGRTPIYPTKMAALAAFMMIGFSGSWHVGGAYSIKELTAAMDEDGIKWRITSVHDPLNTEAEE